MGDLSLPRNTSNDNPIAKYRLRVGLTQEQLAAKLGVNKMTVYRWESGESFPRKSKLIAMAEIFNCTPGQLIE